MSETPFMPFWIANFLAKTMHLDATEVGAYMLLIMAQWTRDGRSLPNDPKKLQRVARCGRNWPKVWAVVGPYFDTDEDGLFNQTCRELFQNVASKRAVNSQSGALGGTAKALKAKENGLANAKISLQRNPSILEIEIERVSKSEGKPSLVRLPTPSRFDEFWNVYPHRGGAKKGRKPAEAKYAAAVRGGADEQDIIDGARRAVHDRQVRAGFARNPETWLNQAGWNDEIDVSRESQNGNGNHNGPRPGPHNAMLAGFAAAANNVSRRT